jgi:type VI secretion system protein ImpK
MTSTPIYKYSSPLPVREAYPSLSHQIFSNERGYYRSKLFNTLIGINPLIAAASPLFSLAPLLADNQSLLDAYTLSQDLQHEIKAFENSAKMQHYRSDTILVTRYLLCAFLDEIILHAPSGKISDWQHHSLLTAFHQTQDDGEKFFVLLERFSQDPDLHIDLLECMYLCLRFGYSGKYRNMPEGKDFINQLARRLFEGIRFQRGELKKELHISPARQRSLPPVGKMSLPLWLILSFTCAALLTLYSSFSYMLGNNAQSLYQQISHLADTHSL